MIARRLVERWPPGGGRLAVIGFLGLALAAAGGTSRYDAPTQAIVRLAAILALAASLWPLELGPLRRHAGLIVALGVAASLPALQLVPLPPAWWAALPGHAVYAEIARAAGVVVWRPLSLAPDLTVNSLFALLPAIAAVVAALFLDVRGRIRLALGLVALAVLSALLGLMQLAAGGMALHLYSPSTEDAPVGLFANPNHHAALLAGAMPLVGAIAGLWLRGGARPRVVLALALGAAMLMGVTILLTGSRMGLVLGVAGSVGAIAAFRATGARLALRERPQRIAAGVVALTVAGVLGGALLRGGALERLAAMDRMSEIRIATLAPLAQTASAYLPFGAGFGSFDPVFRRFEPDALLSTIYLNQAHDEPMQLAIEGGMPALLLLALFLAWWTRSAWRIARWRRGSARRRALATAALATTAVLMLSSLVDYPLRTPILGVVFALGCVEMARGAGAAGP